MIDSFQSQLGVTSDNGLRYPTSLRTLGHWLPRTLVTMFFHL